MLPTSLFLLHVKCPPNLIPNNLFSTTCTNLNYHHLLPLLNRYTTVTDSSTPIPSQFSSSYLRQTQAHPTSYQPLVPPFKPLSTTYLSIYLSFQSISQSSLPPRKSTQPPSQSSLPPQSNPPCSQSPLPTLNHLSILHPSLAPSRHVYQFHYHHKHRSIFIRGTLTRNQLGRRFSGIIYRHGNAIKGSRPYFPNDCVFQLSASEDNKVIKTCK